MDDLGSWVSRLKEEGVEFRNDIVDQGGRKQIRCVDPSGNVVELFQPEWATAGSAWGTVNQPHVSLPLGAIRRDARSCAVSNERRRIRWRRSAASRCLMLDAIASVDVASHPRPASSSVDPLREQDHREGRSHGQPPHHLRRQADSGTSGSARFVSTVSSIARKSPSRDRT